METLSIEFLQEKADDLKFAIGMLRHRIIHKLTEFDNTNLLINANWMDEIIDSLNYRYLNAIQAYNEVNKMINEYKN